MPTTSVTATTSTDRMHMIYHKQRAFFGRFTDLVGLACLSFSSAISPFPGIFAFPPHNRGGGSVRWPHGGQDARRLGAAVIIG